MRLRTIVAVLVAMAALIAAITALPAGAQDDGGKKKVLRLGQAQDVQTLNPFVAQDEENFRAWSLNWDLLVNFSPDDLTPVPGIAESWDVSPDKKTVTFKLIEGAKWSDGEPITSKDVKYSLDKLGTDSLIFSGYTSNVTSIETPDENTVVVKTKQPDARMIGGLFIYMIPEHVYGKVPLAKLKKDFQPPLPMVGSGPYVVTEFEHGRILRMERNPNFRGEKPAFDEIQFIKYGSADAVERALRLGEIDAIPEAQAPSFEKLGQADNVKTDRAPSPSFTQLTFNLCSEENCPDAKFNPAVQDRTVRQAIAYAVDRERVNTISTRGTSFPGHGILPQYYKSWYEQPADDYPYDPDKANQMLDDAGWTREGDGTRSKDGVELSFDLFVRSESPENIQAAKLVAEQAREIGVDFKVQVVSVDKLTEITTREVDGKMAPDFDTFIWGWGGDPYDPSALLQLITTDQIGGSSDAFYSNPEYDRLFDEQAGEFDHAKRKELIRQMVALSQRDLPYLVLTDDPWLEAYRSDRMTNVAKQCPKPSGDVLCQQVNYAAIAELEPGEGGDDGGSSTGIIAVIALVVVAVAAFLFVRWRRSRGGREPLELET
jgi:peptide/nickel transport system substrate-binding protein